MLSRLGVACLIVLAGCTRQSPAPEQAKQVSADEAAPVTGPAAVAATVDRGHAGEAAPAVQLAGLDGRPVTLAGYRGKPLLMNLWATWCAPCLAEMPALDQAAGTLAGRVTFVVANQGDDRAKVQPFVTRMKLRHVRPLLDAKMAVSTGLSANLPTTILYDRAGREVWRVTGGRDWTSPAARKLRSEAG